jgi:hypothetical protein
MFLHPPSGAEVRSNGSQSLPFMMKVMLWYFGRHTHKVMIALILVMFVLVLV